ncbi:hypothetical protein PSTG_17672, partial [Puccinia striiformis f. sp. tritici PST-78]
MPLRHSNEDLTQEELIVTESDCPNCGICQHKIMSREDLFKTPCNHSFHRNCISKHFLNKTTCPECEASCNKPLRESKASSGYNTRQHSKNQSNTASTAKQGEQLFNTPGAASEEDDINIRVSAAVEAMQGQLLRDLTDKMSGMIQTTIETTLRRVSNLDTNPNEVNQSNIPFIQPVESRLSSLDQERSAPNRNFSNSPGVSYHPPPSANCLNVNSEFFSRPEKVSHIIHNWHVKFTGNYKDLSVDNFIYRVEALTRQTLGGNFDLLCNNISSLFEAKASDWYWRFHKSTREVKWENLCNALRRQFRDSRTDEDIRELIRDRKQKANEKFDTFYDSVVQLTDRLDYPMGDSELIEILRRNLLPEIQHEILNLHIGSICHLRELCRKREFFMEDMLRKHSYTRSRPYKGQVAEVLREDPVNPESLGEDPFSQSSEDCVEAIALTCWNCGVSGHRYQDCERVEVSTQTQCSASEQTTNKHDRINSNFDDSKELVTFLPYHLGYKNKLEDLYLQKDNRINNEVDEVFSSLSIVNLNLNNPKLPSRSSSRINSFWKKVRQARVNLLSALFDKPNDIRPYANVKLFGKNVLGLLDTGASISCIGSKLASDFIFENNSFKKIHSVVKTADGISQKV